MLWFKFSSSRESDKDSTHMWYIFLPWIRNLRFQLFSLPLKYYILAKQFKLISIRCVFILIAIFASVVFSDVYLKTYNNTFFSYLEYLFLLEE